MAFLLLHNYTDFIYDDAKMRKYYKSIEKEIKQAKNREFY